MIVIKKTIISKIFYAFLDRVCVVKDVFSNVQYQHDL